MCMCIYIYIYIYIYNLPPKIDPPLGGKIFATINLDGGTITPLIRNNCWFDLPPS